MGDVVVTVLERFDDAFSALEGALDAAAIASTTATAIDTIGSDMIDGGTGGAGKK